MKRQKSALIMAAVLTSCSLIACGGGGGSTTSKPPVETYPEYENNKSMWVGGWDPPVISREDYQLAKDMGLTHMFIDASLASKGTADYYKQLEYCEDVGLKAIVGMDTLLANDDNVQLDTFDYSQYPAVDMINMWDEPPVSSFADVAERVETLNELYAGKDITLYVNGNPAAPLTMQTPTTTTDYVQKLYDQVLSKVNGRKIFSTDVYPLLNPRGLNIYELDTSWLFKMSVYADMAKQHDGEFHMFIQSYDAGDCRPIESVKDFSFQIYTDMAFGINGYSYFTYRASFLSGFGGGCVDNSVSCKPTDLYYWAKDINAEIAKFDHVYLSFDWDGVMTVNGTVNTADDDEYVNPSFNIYQELDSIKCLNKITATEDTVVGQFEDADGNPALMITNFTQPHEEIEDVVSLEFKDCNRALVYRNGERYVYEVKNNKLNLSVPSATGLFVIPIKI